MICDEEDPDRPGITCVTDRQDQMHRHFHTSDDGGTWQNRNKPLKKPKVAPLGPDDRAGEPDPKSPTGDWPTSPPSADGDADPEDIIGGWVRYAINVLHEFLKTRRSPFTTPEHVWPLLVEPPHVVADPRKRMRAVRNHAVACGWMREVDSVRLRDTYRTRDGAEFKMNKIVPVFESLISKPSIPDFD